MGSPAASFFCRAPCGQGRSRSGHPSGANEFAAGNSRSPPARTAPSDVAPVHRCRHPSGAAEAAATTAESPANCAGLHLRNYARGHSPKCGTSCRRRPTSRSHSRDFNRRWLDGRRARGASPAKPRPWALTRMRHELSAQADIAQSQPRFQSPRLDARKLRGPHLRNCACGHSPERGTNCRPTRDGAPATRTLPIHPAPRPRRTRRRRPTSRLRRRDFNRRGWMPAHVQRPWPLNPPIRRARASVAASPEKVEKAAAVHPPRKTGRSIVSVRMRAARIRRAPPCATSWRPAPGAGSRRTRRPWRSAAR